jgi:hypothetical protein
MENQVKVHNLILLEIFNRHLNHKLPIIKIKDHLENDYLLKNELLLNFQINRNLLYYSDK